LYNFFEMEKTVRNVFYFLILILSGCSGTDSVKISDQSYFPLRVGNYQIYQVSETVINNSICTDPVPPAKNYQLKSLIYDSLKNAEGGYTYNIHRYTRSDPTKAWTDLDTWSARVNSNQLIVNESNTPYLKLVFPFTSKSKWNGNQYNSQEEEDYTLTNLGQSYQLSNGEKYTGTQTVVQNDLEDFYVKYDKRIEVYAPSVGLIYKETTQLTYLQDSCYGQQKVKLGLIYTQTLISSGHE